MMPGWWIRSANINNGSNCWLYIDGNLIAQPWQSTVLAFTPYSQKIHVQLTATAPPGQQNEPSPTGQCTIQVTDVVQLNNPGTIQNGLPVVQKQAVLLDTGNITTNGSHLFTVGPQFQSITVLNIQTGTADAAVTGQTTSFPYFSATTFNGTGEASSDVDPSFESALSLNIANISGTCRFVIIGNPYPTDVVGNLQAGLPSVALDGGVTGIWSWGNLAEAGVNINHAGAVGIVKINGQTYVDKSGTISVGGTAQTITTGQNYAIVQNPDNATEDLGVCWTGTANLANASTLRLPPGKGIAIDTLQNVSVVAATGGHAFFCVIA